MKSLLPKREIQSTLDRFLGEPTPIKAIERLAGGYSNENYQVHAGTETYVVRLCRGERRSPDTELAYLQCALATDLLGFDCKTGNMLTRWIRGTLLADAPVGPDVAAVYARQLHASIPSGIASYNPVRQTRDLFESAGILRGRPFEAFSSLEWHPRSISGCHNDLHPWNILRTDEGFRTLDWELAGDNDPAFDLAALVCGMNYTEAQCQELYRSYGGESLEPAFIWSTRLLFQCREHAWALAQLERGCTTPEIRHQIRETGNAILRLQAFDPR